MVKDKKVKSFYLAIFMKILGFIVLFSILVYLIVPRTSFYYMNKTYMPVIHRLNKRDLIMTPGDRYRLRLIRPNTRVSFSSLDIKVADVTPLGTVIAFRTGKTYITAKYDNRTLRCRVRVIKLNKKKIKIKQGKSYDLDIKGPIIFKKATWSSSNEKVARVNRFGKVKGLSKGRAVIKVKIAGKTLECSVIVD